MKQSDYLFLHKEKPFYWLIKQLEIKISYVLALIIKPKILEKMKLEFHVVIFDDFSTFIETWLYDSVLTNMMTSVY